MVADPILMVGRRVSAVSNREAAFPRRKQRPGYEDIRPKGVGNVGRLGAPAASCAKQKAHELVTTGPPDRPTFPHTNGFHGFLRALPGEPGFLATIAGAMRSASSPT